MPQALPANPNLDWLKKTARQRLVQLRSSQPDAGLHRALLAVAHDYGFKSWRALKSHVDRISPTVRDRDRVFEAARVGDVEAVRRAFASGFDPATPDADGRTVHQIAKDRGHEAIEVLARNLQGGKIRPDDEMQAIQAVMRAAQSGDLDALRAGLDAHPEHFLKAELVLRLDKAITSLGLTQRAAARRIGATQPELSKILGGNSPRFPSNG